MDFLLSAKGADVNAWRAVENFNSAYRQGLIDLAASERLGSIETVFTEAGATIETAINTHKTLLKRLNSLIDGVSSTASGNLKESTTAFYTDLYLHFGFFHSTHAFYQLSMSFLKQASRAIIAQTTDKLGPSACSLPEISLSAVGPAGRGEYSPFSQLQILLVHGDASESQRQLIDRFCDALHDGFEAAGLAIDAAVTPRNARWRGTLTEWQERCENGLRPQTAEEPINLCRLIDLYPLNQGEELARELKETSYAALLGSRSALTDLIDRMLSLSNGLGIMGRFKLERKGNNYGKFRLRDHGLLPFSVALSALSLIKEVAAVSSFERIQELLKRHELDVDMAERMLRTWHILHHLRLCREQSFHIGDIIDSSLFIDPAEMTAEQRQSLKETLESVAVIQRHVEITFSGMEG